MPAFINLQQYYLERFLVRRAGELPDLEIRWGNRVAGLERRNDGARLTVDTPDGPYRVDASWVVAADGARSTLRRLLHLPFVGQVFEERFLIADVKMLGHFPPERWFWFEPPFHAGHRRCCTSSLTTSGASTCSSERRPTRSRSKRRSG
jgi:3-(3-hydroxy-phenyl)propionate hydroxylase